MVEGRIGHTLFDLLRRIPISQSHESVHFQTIWTVTSNHLPNSHSVHVCGHAIAIVSEGRVGLTENHSIIQVVIIVLSDHSIQLDTSVICSLNSWRSRVELLLGPGFWPMRFLEFAPSRNLILSVTEVHRNCEGSHFNRLKLMEGCLNSISQSDERDHVYFSVGSQVFGDGHESANIVPILVDEEETASVLDVGNVGELAIR